MFKLIFLLMQFYIFTIVSFTINAVELNIATVDNGHMLQMQKLSKAFEETYPDITLNWHVYNEGSLRMRVIADIASEGGNYDVVTVGMYETPIWSKRGWLSPITTSPEFNIDDLLPAVRDGLSLKGELFASPFYGESSILMYRQDLFEKAGVTITNRPTWAKIEEIAAKLHNPEQQIYGICLRGKPGWGDNMALVSTMVNGFGGRWFDMSWSPQLNTKEWKQATQLYIKLLQQYGPPQPENNSFNEILELSRNGKCAMWVDASVAASFITDASKSEIASKWGFSQSPYAVTEKGANWLWAWALAIPKSTTKQQAAETFINWATSKNYIKLVAEQSGWGAVPTGTRQSTYENTQFLAVAGKFANVELNALNLADPIDNTLLPSPYQGVQFASIPEFVAIAGFAGQKLTDALSNKITLQKALEDSQTIAERQIKRAGYRE